MRAVLTLQVLDQGGSSSIDASGSPNGEAGCIEVSALATAGDSSASGSS
ncbi:MAG TPA: hypothetical protein VHN14_02220 [Kofleriaceae bacterium]|nr:hypothetical protein [Kofleriaceae bacterium]